MFSTSNLYGNLSSMHFVFGMLPSLPIIEQLKDGVGSARSALHADTREAVVPFGISLLQAEDRENGPTCVSDIFRGARERFRTIDPKDEASVLSTTE